MTQTPKWPVFEQDEIDAATQVLLSGRVNYWTGDQGKLFEQEFAQKIGARYAIALGNGTLALDLALRALHIEHGDEIIVTPRSFMASASAIALLGAEPRFVDVDASSQNITVETIEPAITNRTRAILVVHHAGWPCDMPAIKKLADSFGIAVIEDCAQAHGAEIQGQHVGTFGDVGAFSFCQDKIMTTGGEGGMLVTNDPDVDRFARSFKDHGKNLQKMAERKPGNNAFKYLHDQFGSNYRMTEMQAAIGRVQLQKLHHWRAIRNSNALRWQDLLKDTPALRIPGPSNPQIAHAYYKFYVFVETSLLKSGWNRDRILSELTAQGVQAFSGSCPEIYMEAAFDAMPDSRPAQPLVVAPTLGETSIMLLVDPTITHENIERDAKIIDSVMRTAAFPEAAYA